MTEWLLVLAGVALTFGTAVFVVAEFSFVALDKTTVQRAIEAGDAAAKPVLASLGQLSTQLSASQVGITLTTLVLGFIAQPSIGQLVRPPPRRPPPHPRVCSFPPPTPRSVGSFARP